MSSSSLSKILVAADELEREEGHDSGRERLLRGRESVGELDRRCRSPRGIGRETLLECDLASTRATVGSGSRSGGRV